MPWWAIAYIVVCVILYIAGAVDDYLSKKRVNEIICSTISCSFILTFVFAYYNANLFRLLGGFIPFMAFTGVCWELYIANKELQREFPDPDLTDKENKVAENIVLILINLIIVPGYCIGIYLSYRIIKAMVYRDRTPHH